MRKLYNEFFYIPKHGKIREKVMLTHVATTVTIVMICLAAMSITAYAYFSQSIASASNTIEFGNFKADVSITIKDSNNDTVTVTNERNIQSTTLDAGEYTVLLSKGASTANTGFCIITINDTEYYTQQIGVDVKKNQTDENAKVKFTLKVSSATPIEVLSHWGTSSCYGYEEENKNLIYIESGDEIDLTTSTVGSDESSSAEEQDKSNGTASNESSATPTTETTPSDTTETSEPTTGPSNTTDPATQSSEPTDNANTPPTTENKTTTESK